MNEPDATLLGTTIEELTYKVTYGPEGENTLWEHKLRLHIRSKPSWCPTPLWAKLCSFVLIQSKQDL